MPRFRPASLGILPTQLADRLRLAAEPVGHGQVLPTGQWNRRRQTGRRPVRPSCRPRPGPAAWPAGIRAATPRPAAARFVEPAVLPGHAGFSQFQSPGRKHGSEDRATRTEGRETSQNVVRCVHRRSPLSGGARAARSPPLQGGGWGKVTLAQNSPSPLRRWRLVPTQRQSAAGSARNSRPPGR